MVIDTHRCEVFLVQANARAVLLKSNGVPGVGGDIDAVQCKVVVLGVREAGQTVAWTDELRDPIEGALNVRRCRPAEAGAVEGIDGVDRPPGTKDPHECAGKVATQAVSVD